ncbi:MAG: ABC transporter transmembrane domain-containing protein, partial [Candidatus Binatus sp.]
MQQGEEKQLGRARDYALLKFVWTYVRPYRRLFFLSVILMPLNSAFALAQPYIIQLIIDLFLAHHKVAPPAWLAAIFRATGHASLMTMGPIYLLLVAGEFATFYGQFYLTVMVAQYSLSDLRLAVFNHVERLPMSFFDRTPVGRLVSRMTTDIDAINDMFASGSLTVFVDVMTMTGIVIIMWAKSPHLALWALIAIPPLLLFINIFRVRARLVYRQIRERLAAVNAYLSESLAGMTVIQLFTRERTSRDEFDVLNMRSRDAQMMANIYETGLFAAVDTVASITIGVILWAGGGEALHRAITIGTLVGFMQYAQMFFMPLREISNKYTAMQSALAAAERIEQLMEEPLIVSSPAMPKLPPVSRGAIVFDHVRFEYRPHEPVLNDLSFTVEPGQKIAIVGPTGSGKTTIIKLL